ncbi:MAG: transglutaminase-like cysteine peptidase [Proteobacteria bacterium]|nr:transglutaminase-like cysteine peptidase [Pseudomonadota bacterium]
MERFHLEKQAKAGECKVTQTNKCHYKTWANFTAKISKLDRVTQLQKVNAFLNQAPYVADPKNWGVKDYWATPGQFFSKFGDCEDYAIAKFLTLRALGFSGDALRVVVVRDLNLKIGHAILAAYVDGDIYILDNQIKQVIKAQTIRHYRPIYSVNEDGWWLHKSPKGKKKA